MAARQHNLIVANVVGELRSALRQGPCEVYPSDMRVKIESTGSYTYPDVTIVYGEPRFESEHRDTLPNPLVVVEVLSDSTESYDRGGKFVNRACASAHGSSTWRTPCSGHSTLGGRACRYVANWQLSR